MIFNDNFKIIFKYITNVLPVSDSYIFISNLIIKIEFNKGFNYLNIKS